MIKASYYDKSLVVRILSRSFDNNSSVNFIIPQDKNRLFRINALMDYSFEMCFAFGEVFLSDNRKACALVLFPEQKKVNFKSVLLDLKLILYCTGVSNIGKAMAREVKIKKLQPKVSMYYLWFIGVDPEHQNTGIGTILMNELLLESKQSNRPIYLETSTLKNLPWYKKFGFEVYNELDLGYKLFFLKREI